MALSPVEARHQKIIALLDSPMSVEQLKDELPVPYHTLRRDLHTLREQGIVIPTGMLHNRKPTYVVANRRPIPQLYKKDTNDYVSPLDVQRIFASDPHGLSGGMLSARYLWLAVSSLLDLAAQASDGIDVTAHLEDIRTNLKQSYVQLTVTADMVSQILASRAWWSNAGLKSLTNDPDWNAVDVRNMHAYILKELFNSDNQANDQD